MTKEKSGGIDRGKLTHASRYRCATGNRRPTPNALLVTFNPGAAWRRLYSFKSIKRITRFTIASSKPILMISDAERALTTYSFNIASNTSYGGSESWSH